MPNFKFSNLAAFRGKKILIMGLGVLGGGAGVAQFFAKLGARVTVTDLKKKKDLQPSLAPLKDLPIKYILGKHRKEDFLKSDLIIRNPDVPLNTPFLKIARQAGIPVEMDESLFLRFCPVPVIGVTGTRGKTTTVILIGEILKRAGFPTILGGNLPGVATLSFLPKITAKTSLVLELSSWQLQGLGWAKISPQTALITNIYPDHLNRYKSLKDYLGDKRLIFLNQKTSDILILNWENKITRGFARNAQAKVIWFKKSDWSKNWPLKILGEHNRENAAAALAVGRVLKIRENIIKQAISNFPGVPHRLEVVRQLMGVTFVDDTCATMPEAAIAALKTYADKPIILICGGNSKNLDLTNFAEKIIKRAKAVVFLAGTATAELESKIRNQGSKIKILGKFDNFKKAILTARKNANPGDIVLLSPGCTSFGMFKNEIDRGEQFKKIVWRL